MARYNFTNFLVRNFDISIESSDHVHRMLISGFLNYDEALQYARKLYADAHISEYLRRCRPLVISQPNLALIGTHFSYSDYADFYRRTFTSLQVSDEPLLTIPEGVEFVDPEDIPAEEEEDEEETEKSPTEGDLDFGEDFW